MTFVVCFSQAAEYCYKDKFTHDNFVKSFQIKVRIFLKFISQSCAVMLKMFILLPKAASLELLIALC